MNRKGSKFLLSKLMSINDYDNATLLMERKHGTAFRFINCLDISWRTYLYSQIQSSLLSCAGNKVEKGSYTGNGKKVGI